MPFRVERQRQPKKLALIASLLALLPSGFSSGFTFLPLISLRVAATETPKYNVLFIASDDLRPELGCYGNPIIKTPNIDRLSARGTRFERAYCQYPLCNPSRTSLLTSRYATQTGVMDNNIYFRVKHPDYVTLPQYFKMNGYSTLRAGKIFHGGIDDLVSWTEGGEPIDPAITERGNPNPQTAPRPGAAATGAGQSRAAQSDRIVVLEGNGESHGDYKTATRAIQYYEIGTRTPLIIAVPGTKAQVSERPVQLLDMYPTLVELCGLPPPQGIEGHSLGPLLRDPKATWNYPAFTVTLYQGKLGKSVRVERWHYVEWDEGQAGAMLFDHSKDPRELKNLAAYAAYAKTVQEMKLLMKQLP